MPAVDAECGVPQSWCDGLLGLERAVTGIRAVTPSVVVRCRGVGRLLGMGRETVMESAL